MDNELRKTLDVKLNINIDGTAAFGIASIAGLCFCFYTGTKSRYSAQIGTLNLSPVQSAAVSV